MRRKHFITQNWDWEGNLATSTVEASYSDSV